MNKLTAARYYSTGVAAEDAGDFQFAHKNYARAFANAQAGMLNPGTKALYLSDWARVSGYLGSTEDAEHGFLDTLAFIKKAKGKADDLLPNTYWELALLYQDTGRCEKAVTAFSNAVEQIEPRRPEQNDPGAFADVLEDYAKCLAELGRQKEAEAIKSKLAAWKKEHPLPAKHKPRRYNATIRQ